MESEASRASYGKSRVKPFAELGVATIYEAAGRRGLLDIPLTPIIFLSMRECLLPHRI